MTLEDRAGSGVYLCLSTLPCMEGAFSGGTLAVCPALLHSDEAARFSSITSPSHRFDLRTVQLVLSWGLSLAHGALKLS